MTPPGLKGIPDKYLPKDNHPSTDKPFVRGTVSFQQDYDEHSYGPPRAPKQALYEIDEYTNEPVYVRDLTDEEFAEAQAEYKKASKEWAETQGRFRTVGAQHITCMFYTAAGAWAEGAWDGEAWHWTRWNNVIGKS